MRARCKNTTILHLQTNNNQKKKYIYYKIVSNNNNNNNSPLSKYCKLVLHEKKKWNIIKLFNLISLKNNEKFA